MNKKRLYIMLFALYIIFLILIVLLKFDGSFTRITTLHQSIVENEKDGIRNINLTFFKSISPFLKNIAEPYAFKNIIGNIIVFIPLGFFVSKIWFKNIFIKTSLMCILTILIIEFVQLVFKIGIFDVDDIFLNFIGCLVGYFVNFLLSCKGVDK